MLGNLAIEIIEDTFMVIPASGQAIQEIRQLQDCLSKLEGVLKDATKIHIQIAEYDTMKKRIVDLNKTIDAYQSICNEYIPLDKLDEANAKVILLAVGEQEQIGRDLLQRRPLRNQY